MQRGPHSLMERWVLYFGKRSLGPWYSLPRLLAAYVLPAGCVGGAFFWWASHGFDNFVLCARTEIGMVPLDIPVARILFWSGASVFFALLLAAGLMVLLWQERRAFFSLIHDRALPENSSGPDSGQSE